MDFNVCICEDTPRDVSILEKIVCKWAENKNINVVFSVYTGVFDFDFSQIEHFGIIFLDVRLGKDMGYKLAEKIRVYDSFVPIAFTTLYEEYALQCHGMMPLQYILKPLREDKCFEALDTAVKHSRMRAPMCIVLNDIEFCAGDIVYFEADDHTVWLHQAGKTDAIPIAMTLSSIMDQLPQHLFFKAHRSYIVNILHVKKIIDKQAYMTNDAQIPISREFFAELKRRHFERLRGEI